MEISRSMRLQTYRRRDELKDALGRLVYECRSLGLAMEPIDLTPSGGVMASPWENPCELSRGVFTHPAVRVGLDLIAGPNDHQIKEANRRWDKARGLSPEALSREFSGLEQVVDLNSVWGPGTGRGVLESRYWKISSRLLSRSSPTRPTETPVPGVRHRYSSGPGFDKGLGARWTRFALGGA